MAAPQHKLRAILGDITTLDVDAIVNAANTALLGGGGVDGAIHRRAGPELLAQCRTLGGCPTGQARLTQGYNLPARFVIHTVGPVWQGDSADEDKLLASCYRHCMRIVVEQGFRTIAFPAISTGVYRFPAARAAQIAVATVTETIRETLLDEAIFCCFSPDMLALYQTALKPINLCR
ncbi:MAG: O-acetyl-ADP-ribose deacetylase [Burkholderiaceae bacterium]|jgi:O-acetyl-ADP-ribose deacetylase (regulator of RNase III)|nr:O-acetyl-ADP-ribose deacetylase [Burkholderiaceae bacterium]